MQTTDNRILQEAEESTVDALDALGATGQARQRLLDDAIQRARNEFTTPPTTAEKRRTTP